MKEFEFKEWLDINGYTKKVQSDLISRVKRIERVLGYIDIDNEYINDKGVSLLEALNNKSQKKEMTKFDLSSLQIGKYQIHTYKYAVSMYFKFIQNL